MAPDGNRHLDFTDLQAGQSIAGVVAFDLPAEHGQLVLPHSDGEPPLVWKFSCAWTPPRLGVTAAASSRDGRW
jgi:hypothetical protein